MKVAIIGIGCQFPAAPDRRAFWANVRDGVDAIGEIPASHFAINDYYDANPQAPDRIYARRGGFLEPVAFDALRWGVAPRDIEATDTAQLLGLMVAQAALDDAGYGPKLRALPRERTSVLLGVTGALSLVIPLGARLGHPQWRRALADAGVVPSIAEDVLRRISASYVPWQENSFPGLLGNVVAGRIANRLDLHGTSCVVDAACASSLSAVHLGLMELESGRADVVLAGGLDTFNDIFMYMCFSKTPALSPSGDARPFDADGDGTILGEGLGMVVLKRLEDAERDGDRIYAVIRGLGSSSDGKGQAIYAPASGGQARALRRAYAEAGIPCSTVGLLEAHGTGTRVGDATEVEALRDVFGAAQAPFCALGSVKSMIGHTKAAAGSAGLIKAALSIYHRTLPPTLKVRRPNPVLEADGSPFYLNADKRPWWSRTPRCAGVSAFGFGGSNFHCVVEQHGDGCLDPDWDGRTQIFACSAPSQAALVAAIEAACPRDAPAWATVERAAAASRTDFDPVAPHRCTWVVRKGDNLDACLDAALAAAQGTPGVTGFPRPAYYSIGPAAPLAALFVGQGAQSVGMLRDLACRFPAIGRELDALEPAVAAKIYPPARFDESSVAADDAALRATDVAQPALGAVCFGAWQVLRSFGVAPRAAAGHSFGELVALAAAEVLDSHALRRLAQRRGYHMAQAASSSSDAGTMLAVHMPLEELDPWVAQHAPDLRVANRNAPRQGVLSGPCAAIESAHEALESAGHRCTPLSVAAAFHSPRVAAAARALAAELQDIELHPPRFDVFANTTAAPYPHDPEAIRGLLAQQLASSVDFEGTLRRMTDEGIQVFVEVGPGRRLCGLVRDTLGPEVTVLGLGEGLEGLAQLLAALAALGQPIALDRFEHHEEPRDLLIPIDAPRMAISVCGAHPKPQPSALPPRPTAPEPAMPSHDAPRPQASAAESVPSVHPPVPESAPAMSPAAAYPNPHLAALLELQQQTAALHQQFLEGQAEAIRIFARLMWGGAPSVALPADPPRTPTPHTPASRVAPPPNVAPSPRPIPPPSFVAPSPSVAPATTVSASPASSATPATSNGVASTLLTIVAEKTGYPAAMLDLSMGLDADLGIDSIKRVEILSALQEALPHAPVIAADQLGELRTLGDIVGVLSGTGTPAPTPQPTSAANTPKPSEDLRVQAPSHAGGNTNLLLVQQPVPSRWVPTSPRIAANGTLWLVAARDNSLRNTVRHALEDLGFSVEDDPSPSLAGIVCLDAGPRSLLAVAQHLSALPRGGIVASVTALDGALGLRGGPADVRAAEAGGLSGLIKTVACERPDLHCRAIDWDPSSDLDHHFADALLCRGPVEVGCSDRALWTLELAPYTAAEAGPRWQPSHDDVVVLSGGARGVTTAVADDLVAAGVGTVVLLGRTPPPAEEPAWLAGCESETEIKRGLIAHGGVGSRPKAIGDACAAILSCREVRQTLRSLQGRGTTVVYRSVDVGDEVAVHGVLSAVQREHGPVTAIVHGAGVLADCRLEDKTADGVQQVYATKVEGLAHLLSAVDLSALRAIALFSSSTARFGRRGQADYAMANEVLNKRADQLAKQLPHVRVLAVDWGPWEGGMVTPVLRAMFTREGVGIIPLREGAMQLRTLLAQPGPSEVVVLGRPPRQEKTPPSLPTVLSRALRLGEHIVLEDHVLDGFAVLPVALALEWMAHAALHDNPGLSLHGIDAFQVLRGVRCSAEDAVDLEFAAGPALAHETGQTGIFAVPAELRQSGSPMASMSAKILLGTPPSAAALGWSTPPSAALERGSPYERGALFHGPRWHALSSVGRIEPAGVWAQCRVAPRPEQWMRHPLRRRWIADPWVIDAGFQLAILWSQQQLGAPCLPAGWSIYRQYCASFEAHCATPIAIGLTVEDHGPGRLLCTLEWFDGHGQPLARIEGLRSTVDAGLRPAFARTQLRTTNPLTNGRQS